MNPKIAKTILLGVCTICISLFLFAGLVGAMFRYDLDEYEGILFTPALQMESGHKIFGQQMVGSAPYTFAAYGPLYYGVLASVLRFTGLTFLPGRLISLLATLATAFVLYLVVKQEREKAYAGFIAVTLFIMSPATWSFGFIQRVDALGIFFTCLCIAFVLSSRGRSRNLLLAGSAAALAFLIKPSLIAASLAVIVFLAVTRSFKRLGEFLVGGAIVMAVAVLALLLTDNSGYIFNQSANAHTAFMLSGVIGIVHNLIQSPTLIASLAISTMLLTRNITQSRDAYTLLPLIYVLVAGGVGLAECGKAGASINYFYELFVALALCAGVEFGRIEDEHKDAFLLASILLIMSFSVELAFRAKYSIKDRLLVSLSKAKLHEKTIQNLVDCVPEQEPVASHYPDLVLRAGRPLYFNDVIFYLIGPDAFRAQLSSYLEEKKLAAYITMYYTNIPGYRLVEEVGSESSYLASRGYIPGPLLYLRDDLWQKRMHSLNNAP